MINRLLVPLIAFVFSSIMVLPCGAQTPPEDSRAAGLLELMAQTYAELQSYSDTNEVTYRNTDGTERLHVNFRIWFNRPSDFRIDAESKAPQSKRPRREVMWSNGAAARAWSSDKPVTTKPQIKIIGSGMFGAYAFHVPTLLEASFGGAFRLHQMSSAQFAGEETVEGVSCYRVRGSFQGDAYEIWLGTVDNLIRKIAAKYSDHQLEEIHRNVTVNQPIAREVFRFAPEEEKLPPPASASPAKSK